MKLKDLVLEIKNEIVLIYKYLFWPSKRDYNAVQMHYGKILTILTQQHFRKIIFKYCLYLFLLILIVTVMITTFIKQSTLRIVPQVQSAKLEEIKKVLKNNKNITFYDKSGLDFYDQLFKYGIDKNVFMYLENKGKSVNKKMDYFTRFENYIIKFQPTYRVRDLKSVPRNHIVEFNYFLLVKNYQQWKLTYPKRNIDNLFQRFCSGEKDDLCIKISLLKWHDGNRTDFNQNLDLWCKYKNGQLCTLDRDALKIKLQLYK